VQRTAGKQRGRPFAKGMSGNPGGRPKKTPQLAEIEAQARAAAPDAIRRLVKLMDSNDGRVSIAACNAILDRGYGKPTIAVDHAGTIGRDLSRYTDAALVVSV
jgi:Family of unknown function (DUF5681)